MKLVFLQLVVTLGSVHSARILALLPLGARSHHVFFQPILRTLALRGHNVTVYSPFPQPEQIPNLTDVFIKSSFLDVKRLDEAVLGLFEKSQLAIDKGIWETAYQACEDMFNHEGFTKLLESNERFDLVITQGLVGQESLLAFGYKFNAPTIALQPKVACTVDNRVSGNTLSLSYIPDIGLPFSNSMTFWERLLNIYSKLNVLYYHYFYQIPKQEALLKRYFKGTFPPVIDLVQNISLIFTLGHSTALYAHPSTPNIIPLAGIHIEKERKPLPGDIQKFMDGAENGLIYFSLGTYFPDHMLGKEYFQNYIDVFKTLPQRVLWKTRAEKIDNLPTNVMIGKWMPQQDILAHPKCILFITHGGMLSQIEALYFGVPVVAVPYFADQPMNARFYVRYHLGVQLHHTKLSAEKIHGAITTVLGDPTYRENMARQSVIFHDLPMLPSEMVVYWTEYVLRHGAAHLKPHAARMPLFQLALLDVLVALLTVIILALSTFFFIIKYIYYFTIKNQKTIKTD